MKNFGVIFGDFWPSPLPARGRDSNPKFWEILKISLTLAEIKILDP